MVFPNVKCLSRYSLVFILILMHLSNELPSNSFHTEIINLIVKELLKIVHLMFKQSGFYNVFTVLYVR